MLIEPFRAIYYNKKKIKNLADVYSPPYDIISPQQQDEYYRVSTYNVVRLELNKSDNPYTSAARFFNAWRKEEILEQDKKPSIYIYAQEFKYKNQLRRTLGFIALAKLGSQHQNLALSHEMTFKAPREDRERLLKTVGANLSCIYALFEDRSCCVNRILAQASRKKPSAIDVRFDSVRHRLWKVDDEKWIKKLQKIMSGKKIFIADGHHRYEAAVNLRNRMKTQSPYNYVMMYFASMQDKNLTILATHRVVKQLPHIPEDIFDITPVANKKKMLEVLDKDFSKAHIFGMYADGKFSALKLKKKGTGCFLLQKRTCLQKAACPLFLDVAILHDHILNGTHDIFYTRDAAEAVELVNKKQYKAAFFLNPALATEVRDTSLNGGRMPHKSTYFYPKPLTGIVMRKLEDA